MVGFALQAVQVRVSQPGWELCWQEPPAHSLTQSWMLFKEKGSLGLFSSGVALWTPQSSVAVPSKAVWDKNCLGVSCHGAAWWPCQCVSPAREGTVHPRLVLVGAPEVRCGYKACHTCDMRCGYKACHTCAYPNPGSAQQGAQVIPASPQSVSHLTASSETPVKG